MFFLSFVLVLYLTASVVRRLDDDRLPREDARRRRRGRRVLRDRRGAHRDQRLQPPRPRRPVPAARRRGRAGGVPEVRRREAARLRLGAAPDRAQRRASCCSRRSALYLARRYRQRRWWLCVDAARRRLRLDRLAHRDHDVRRRRARLPLAAAEGDPAAVAGADPGADRDQARPAGDARRDQAVVPPRRRPRRRAAVDARRERQRPARRPRPRAAGVDARSRSSASGLRHARRRRRASAARARTSSTTSGSARCSRSGALGFFGWLWFFARVVRRLGKEAKEDDSERGWLLVVDRGERRGVRGRHVHLRRVLVHPGDVPDVHPRRPRRGAPRRAAGDRARALHGALPGASDRASADA